MRNASSLAIVLVFCGGLAAAWTAAPAAGASIPSDALLQRLQPQGSVSDFAGILSPAERTALDARTADLRRKTGAQFAVVTLSRLLLVAGIRGFSADATYFEAAAPAKQAPKVDFDTEK
jgi:uncharacterized membrane protein YgcG